MQLLTYSDLKTKLQNDCDIVDEDFISETELLGYINEAISAAETAIHNLHHEDKYFLTNATFNWVNGTSDYALPTDIYANKIRKIWYSNGSQNYEIVRIKDLTEVNYFQAGDVYQYLLVNAAGTGPRARFFPTVAETSTNASIWYIREMVRMTTSALATNICEVYECQNFVFAYVRHAVAVKSRNAALIAETKEDKVIQYNLMMETLKEMVPDENNQIPMDLTHYRFIYNWR